MLDPNFGYSQVEFYGRAIGVQTKNEALEAFKEVVGYCLQKSFGKIDRKTAEKIILKDFFNFAARNLREERFLELEELYSDLDSDEISDLEISEFARKLDSEMGGNGLIKFLEEGLDKIIPK